MLCRHFGTIGGKALGPVSFVMVVIGCSQNQSCAPVMTLPVAYRTEATCLADRSDIVSALSGDGYARVFAECRKQPSKGQTSSGIKAIKFKPIA